LALWDAMRDSIDLLNGWTIVCSAFLCAALLYAVGQPIFTDDAWWHLALGAFYLEQGPWLEADPLLFTAAAPPPPASWLADALFYLVWQGLGFTGLRMLHVALAAGILILAWHAIRRVSKSRAAATLGTALFGILAAYRLVQLRPDLFTIAGAITLYLLVLAGEDPPSWRRIAGATASMALWSNLHPAFPIGLALLAAACGASVISALHASAPERSRPRARATRLAWTLALAGLASAANPMGLSAHLLALRAGSSPESLAYVVDEWRATELFSLPVANLPPSPLSWLLVWVLLVGSAAAAAITLRRALRSECAGPVDLVPLALAATALGAMVLASRFLWLGLFPILLIAGPLARDLGLHVRQRPMAMGLAAVALLATVGFQRLGAWPMITHALPRSAEGYRLPYRALKYHADVAWLMADAELHGNLVAPYSAAGFLGFWLAPGIQTAVNGSLNVAPETMNAALAVQSGLGTPEQPELEALLDELEVDLFLGAGLPTPGRANRPAEYTTALLEESPSWLQIFRTPDASLFLRRNARNDDNLARIATYFERSGVPFDPTVGFEPARVLREAPDWAIEKRLVPPELIDRILGLAMRRG